MFFSLPSELRDHHPDLYQLLATSFALDPAAWPVDQSPRRRQYCDG
jgi:Mlc titration factor MtfA (ptsG expression regulator)